MTTHEQLERKIAELHEKMFALQKEIEGVESELVKAKDAEEWPRIGDQFYYIDDGGRVRTAGWSANLLSDDMTMAIGNVFRSERDALFAVERLKVLAEMRKFAFEPDCWDRESMDKCFIFCIGGTIDVYYSRLCDYGVIYFPNEAAARNCISTIGEERLKKYYFGVKDVG